MEFKRRKVFRCCTFRACVIIGIFLCATTSFSQVDVVQLPDCESIFGERLQCRYAYIVTYYRTDINDSEINRVITFDSVLIFCDLQRGTYEFCIQTLRRGDCAYSVVNCKKLFVAGVAIKEVYLKKEE